jgi:hypothetical protein
MRISLLSYIGLGHDKEIAFVFVSTRSSLGSVSFMVRLDRVVLAVIPPPLRL